MFPERSDGGDESTDEPRHSFRADRHGTHLPRREDARLIADDRETGEIERGPHVQGIRRLLDLQEELDEQ